jgi:hypothetical protein
MLWVINEVVDVFQHNILLIFIALIKINSLIYNYDMLFTLISDIGHKLHNNN